MHKDKDFEDLIKNELNMEANRIEPREEVLMKVNEIIENNGYTNEVSKRERVFKNIFPLELNIKRCVTAAVLLVFIIPALTLTFSKEARVIAAEGINQIGRWIYVVNKTNTGYSTVKVEIPENDDPFEAADVLFDYTGLTDKELSEEIGADVYMPLELGGGYKYIQRNKGVSKKDNKTVCIYGFYAKKQYELFLEVSKENSLKYVQDKKVIDVKGNKFYWADGGPRGIYPDYDLQQKPIGIKESHYLIWEYNGLCYTLYNQSGEMSFDICHLIAREFANKTFPSCDMKENSGIIRSETFLPKSTTIREIENMVGFKVKIPEDLPGNYELKSRVVGMDPSEKDCNMFTGEYENGKDTLVLNITEGDWPVKQYERIKEPGDDTRKIVIGDRECLWLYIGGGHSLGWKDGDVYYCLSLKRNDFTSAQEAVDYAKVIIGEK